MEPCTYQPDLHRRIKYIWLDNCTTHNMTSILAAILAQKHTILKYLSLCAIHFCHPSNIFLFSTSRMHGQNDERSRNPN